MEAKENAIHRPLQVVSQRIEKKDHAEGKKERKHLRLGQLS